MHLEILKADGAIAFNGAASLIPGCISCCSRFCILIQIFLMDLDDSNFPEAICRPICKSGTADMRYAMIIKLTIEAGMPSRPGFQQLHARSMDMLEAYKHALQVEQVGLDWTGTGCL